MEIVLEVPYLWSPEQATVHRLYQEWHLKTHIMQYMQIPNLCLLQHCYNTKVTQHKYEFTKYIFNYDKSMHGCYASVS